MLAVNRRALAVEVIGLRGRERRGWLGLDGGVELKLKGFKIKVYSHYSQCDQIWRNLNTLLKFYLGSLVKMFVNILNQLWQFFCPIRYIFIVVNVLTLASFQINHLVTRQPPNLANLIAYSCNFRMFKRPKQIKTLMRQHCVQEACSNEPTRLSVCH